MSCLRRWSVLALLLACLLLPSGRTLAAPGRADPAPISLDEYWGLVEHTRQIVAGLAGMPQSSIRPALDELVTQWQAVSQVRLADGSLVPVDNSQWIAALQSADQTSLDGVKTQVETLLEAHRRYPSALFTASDLGSLRGILAQPRFQWQEAQQDPIRKWLDEQWQRFLRWLAGLFGSPEGAPGEVVEVTFNPIPYLAALLLVIVMAYIFRSFFSDLANEARLADESGADGEPVTADQAFARAQNLSRGGDYRAAVRYLYLSSLLLLDERGLLRYDRSRTNHEYLRSVADQPELAAPLREVIDVFDNVWYGYHNVDEEAFRHYSERVEELKDKRSA